jgi:hypothetical protein
MSKRTSILIVAISCACIGCGMGFMFGAVHYGAWTKKYIMNANAGWLIQHTNRLALIRTGHIEDAVTDIEKILDSSIIQLSWAGFDGKGKFHAERLPEAHRRALKMARMYADAGCRDAFSEESLAILDKIEPGDVEDWPKIFRELQEQNQEIKKGNNNVQ